VEEAEDAIRALCMIRLRENALFGNAFYPLHFYETKARADTSQCNVIAGSLLA